MRARAPRDVFDDLRMRGGEAVALIGSTLSALTTSGVCGALHPQVANLVALRLLSSAMESAGIDVDQSGGRRSDGPQRRVAYLTGEYTVHVALRQPSLL